VSEKKPRLTVVPPEAGERLLTPEEVAAALRVSRSSVYALFAERQLAYVQLGRLRHVRPVDLRSYLERQTVPAEC
jgi:excisionase family DNA binding protein